MIAVLARDLVAHVAGVPVALRRGLKCRRAMSSGTRGRYWLNELPVDLFPLGSTLREGAHFCGVLLDSTDIELTDAVAA